MANSASSRSGRVSPIPMRMPVVKGTASSPASRSVASLGPGRLSGEPKCGPPRQASRGDRLSSMIPCETETRRSAAISSRVSTPGLTWGSRPVSSNTSRAAWARYSTVVSKPRRGKRLARGAVAKLRLVAEREQGLLAAGVPSGTGDRQHLLRREIGGDAPSRRRGEGAVVADVAAQPRQGDEHLARIGHRVAESGVAQPARFRRKFVERCREQVGMEILPVHRAPRLSRPGFGSHRLQRLLVDLPRRPERHFADQFQPFWHLVLGDALAEKPGAEDRPASPSCRQG